MSDRVSSNNYYDYGGNNNYAIGTPGASPSPLAGANPLGLQQPVTGAAGGSSASYEKVTGTNKFVGKTGRTATEEDPDHQEAVQVLNQAGIPITSQSLASAEAQIQSNPQAAASARSLSKTMQTMGGSTTTSGSTGSSGVTGSTGSASMLQNGLVSAAQQLANGANINVWQLLVVALKGSVRDQNDQLRDDLSQLQILSTISSQMSQYADVLQAAQQALDNKMNATTDDSKKQTVEVPLDDQREYNQDDMSFLNAQGGVNYSQTASSDENQNMVGASGLQLKTQTFSQERDQLQKNIDKQTQQYQSDNENKNQVVATITAVLKNYYDMLSSNVRNLDL